MVRESWRRLLELRLTYGICRLPSVPDQTDVLHTRHCRHQERFGIASKGGKLYQGTSIQLIYYFHCERKVIEGTGRNEAHNSNWKK
jgi:hypothetical protein